MCSENANSWAKVFQAVLPVKLPWGVRNNQECHFLSFPNLDLRLEPCIGSYLQQEISVVECVLRSVFLQKSMTGKHYSIPLLFSLWNSKGFQASDLQLEDLICYVSMYLLSISDVSVVQPLQHDFPRPQDDSLVLRQQ